MKSIKLSRYPLSIATAVVIWIVCMIPVPETPLADVTLIDKWTHLVMYAALTTVIWTEYIVRHNTIAWQRVLVFGLLLPILMGCAVELAQAYLTTCRSGDWFDALCNTLGTLIGGAIGCAILYYKKHR